MDKSLLTVFVISLSDCLRFDFTARKMCRSLRNDVFILFRRPSSSRQIFYGFPATVSRQETCIHALLTPTYIPTSACVKSSLSNFNTIFFSSTVNSCRSLYCPFANVRRLLPKINTGCICHTTVHNFNVCLSVCLSVLPLCVYFSFFVAFHVWALLPEIKLID